MARVHFISFGRNTIMQKQNKYKKICKGYCKCPDCHVLGNEYGNIPVPKTEQCFCQSYYDDDNVLQDCTCGKCSMPTKTQKDWEKEFDNEFTKVTDTDGFEMIDESPKTMKYFIRQLLKQQKKEIIKEIENKMEEASTWDRDTTKTVSYIEALDDIINIIKKT